MNHEQIKNTYLHYFAVEDVFDLLETVSNSIGLLTSWIELQMVHLWN